MICSNEDIQGMEDERKGHCCVKYVRGKLKGKYLDQYLNKRFERLEWLVACFSPQRPKFSPRVVHVGFMVDKVALWKILSEIFDFLLSLLVHQCSILSSNIRA
jgi:hypothetical protein